MTANLRGAPPTGPHAVVIEHDQALATHAIYRPATLGATKHPVLVWGEGGCAKDGPQVPEFLNKIFAGLHSPVIIVTGGESDIAYANGKRDFETRPAKIPVF